MEVAERRGPFSLSHCPVEWVSGCSLSRFSRGVWSYSFSRWVTACEYLLLGTQLATMRMLLFSSTWLRCYSTQLFSKQRHMVPREHSSRCLLQEPLVTTSKSYRPWGRGRWVWEAGLSLGTSPLSPYHRRAEASLLGRQWVRIEGLLAWRLSPDHCSLPLLPAAPSSDSLLLRCSPHFPLHATASQINHWSLLSLY